MLESSVAIGILAVTPVNIIDAIYHIVVIIIIGCFQLKRY